MPDFRVFCAPAASESLELRLSREESHHLVAVNRAPTGATVIAFDGRGREWECELKSASKNGAVLAVRNAKTAASRPFSVTLGQALPKGQAMDAIVRKATEIGAEAIVPLETERTQVHFEGDRQDRKIDKWQGAAVEAAKQCGNPWLPQVMPLQPLLPFVEASAGFDLKLLASLQEGAKSLKTVLSSYRAHAGRSPRKVLWLIGPEGDFSSSEYAAALAAGFEPITLGPLVLRCETAAVYALSVLSYELLNP